MASDVLRPRSGASAKALLLTTLGEFVLPHGGAVWTSTIIGALATLGVEERNARQAIARLADDGIVSPAKQGRRVQWRLTPAGHHLLVVGTDRIYHFGAGEDAWDGRWLVVLYSVPEEQRAKRHQLRSQLGFAGFGFLNPGVAVTPHVDRETMANDVLKELGMVPGAVVLRAETGELVSAGDVLRRAWDLDELALHYERFIEAFERRPARTDEARFAALVELVHEWRRFPFVDPEIPRRLLPAHWQGRRAKAVFDARHEAWSPGANAWYERAETGRQL